MYHAVIDSLEAVTPRAWDSLHRSGNPFVSHAFLSGLEQTGCVDEDSGWIPRHLTLYRDRAQRELVGAAPMYLKLHSYGEYVFDWAWADAYRRCGLAYYPKLVSAVPFTPVTGPRLLVRPNGPDRGEQIKERIVAEAVRMGRALGVSSLHWLFAGDADMRCLQRGGHLRRTGQQFHWRNDGYESFDDYLRALTSKRRKQIRRERRQVRESGLAVEILSGDSLKLTHIDVMYEFYRNTVHNHGALPYLTRAFFDYLAEAMADELVLILARDGHSYVAGALFLRGRDALFGRYWGARRHFEMLHFELCYYRPIEWSIAQRLGRFEAGAQGEHKLSRGLLPTPTYSAHWLRHPQLGSAVADFLESETHHVERYARALEAHSPFRQEPQN